MFFICSCIFYLYLCLFICICIFFICICICICIVFVVWQQQQWILAGITDWWTDSACSEGGFRCRVTIYYSQTPLDTNLLSTTIILAYHHCSHKIIIYCRPPSKCRGAWHFSCLQYQFFFFVTFQHLVVIKLPLFPPNFHCGNNCGRSNWPQDMKFYSQLLSHCIVKHIGPSLNSLNTQM